MKANSSRWPRGAVALAAAITASAIAQIASADEAAVAMAIESRSAELIADPSSTVRGQSIAAVELISDFYARRSFSPAWTNPANVTGLLRAIAESRDEGLDPSDYHIVALNGLRAAMSVSGGTSVERADFDLLATDAVVRLGYHLRFGKVDPARFDPQWNLSHSVAGLDPAAALDAALAGEDVYGALRRLAPQQPIYLGLRRELARYRALALRGGWREIPTGTTLASGARDERVSVVRERLTATGDLTGAGDDDDSHFDNELVEAVKRFQGRVGITADGKVGPATLAELNVPVEERILQLRVNLDRGRVMLYQLPPAFVVVNIAGFQVYLVRDHEIAWQARAQVGKPYRMTPDYRSEITYLVFNPTWTVPPGIIRNDILPAARRDPASITRKGLNVIDGSGRIVDPASVDWSRFGSGHIPYTLRQDPGPNNALGRVKFMFPNPFAVYLHDTPSRALFDIDTRTTSSGCVRVERPLELAELLLADPARWNAGAISQAIARGTLQNVTLQERMPVLLVYWTAWVDRNGQVNFRRDVYGRDAKWSAALDAPFSFRKQPPGADPARASLLDSAIAARLQREKARVVAVERQQLGMAAALHDPAALEDDDLIRHAHGRKAVRDQDRDALARETAEVLEHLRFRLRIHRSGRLVEHEDVGTRTHERPRQRDLLPLAARQFASIVEPFAELRCVA
jgi:murein L,D-transpeptidase YcbB/YkuD